MKSAPPTLSRRKPWMMLLLAIPPLACAFGIRWNWPWLEAEHQRLEHWKIPVIWLSEITALLWYTWFCLTYIFAGDSRNTAMEQRLRKDPDPQKPHKLWVVIGTLILSIGLDLSVTLFTLFEEHVAHSAGVEAKGEVVDVTVQPLRNGNTLYSLHCQFHDGLGMQHQCTFFVGSSHAPPGVDAAVARREFPVPVVIAYDPSWPGRCWISDSSDPHHNRMYFMSFSTILFAAILAPALIGIRQVSPDKAIPAAEICPFLAVALVLFLSGVGKIILGEA